jgi:RNA polymerase sigma factor (TIGR02999 family)
LVVSSPVSAGKLCANAACPATSERFIALYPRLRELARAYLQRYPSDALAPTDLVHEVFLHLARRTVWRNDAHLLGIAACEMREVLITHTRRLMATKRGGGWRRVALGNELGVRAWPAAPRTDPSPIHEAIEDLATVHPRSALVVVMRYLAGMTIAEIASAMSLSKSTVEGDCRVARGWLSARLGTRVVA